MAKNFHELRNKMSPKAQEKAPALAQNYAAEIPLDVLMNYALRVR